MPALVGGRAFQVVLGTLERVFGALHVRLIRGAGKQIVDGQIAGVIVTASRR